MPEQFEGIEEARESIRDIVKDPVTKLLLHNSQLTPTQLETLLADSLSRENADKRGRRRLYRSTRGRVSRGAYNRTLIQAQNNVIRSIYTVLLLGHTGLFDSAALQPFIELADTINAYVQETKRTPGTERAALDQLNAKLQEGITALAKRQSFKDIM